ncbi:receptor-type tyrosine-protein phosphatase N2-like [Argiope bruennichi]|uniref:receptor-type tyrosine-protein phosphatase N2-like n=1 Tax=Argiope bruennichi TaxID=94029 RepID=UPI0024952427|nr:receptor-type tyrosine-protein phosphatase N2-like [Argiope bruennichi]
MGDLNAKKYSLLLCIIILSGWMNQCVICKNSVGCFFSPTVCEVEEECFDDNVFGRCQIPFGTDVDLFRHLLGPETIQLLESELSRLFAGGYRWGHDYSQCVVQNILYSSRHQISYDPGLCSRVLQFTLPEVPPEILSELESPEPDELAFIKFKPNRDDPASDIYADEIFSPPIFSESAESKDTDKRTPIHMYPDNEWPNNFGRNFNQDTSEEQTLADKETLIQELLKTAKDTEKLFEGFQDKAERYPDDDTPLIKTELSSDLTQLPAFTEGGIEWLPADDEDDGMVDELIEPYDKKRIKVAYHEDSPFHEERDKNFNRGSSQKNVITLNESAFDDSDNDLLKFREETPDNDLLKFREETPNNDLLKFREETPDNDLLKFQEQASENDLMRFQEAAPTFGKTPLNDDDSNFQWNTKHRTKLMDDDLTRFAKGNASPGRTNILSSTQPENDELSDVIENDYLEDQLYAILPLNKNKPISSNDKRYDTKKPGPTYMIHEDEDGDTSHDDDQMAMQGTDRFIQALSRKVWQNQNQLHSLFTPSVGVAKPLLPFIRRFEATDEFRRIYVTDDDEENDNIIKDKTENPKEPEEKPKTFERITNDQPEVIEGIDNDELKTLRDEDKTANAAKTGEGHLGRYDSVDATHTNLVIKEKSPNEDEAQNLVKVLEKYLDLDRGSFSNVKVNGRIVTFKVNPNSKGLNASEVSTRAQSLANEIKKQTGLTVEGANIGDKVPYTPTNPDHDQRLVILTFALCGGVAGILLAAVAAYLVRRHSKSRDKLQNITQPDTEASQDYQDLCRQRMASKANEKPEPVHSVNSPKKIRSLSQEGQASSSSHSSTSSWNEEPVTSNMDISTGHMILSYMEDHLKNKDRLDREWEALCAYEAELCATTAATQPQNIKKNRYTDVLPYDHSRVILNELTNVSGSDYINASSITDHDPRNPAYIATQGPLPQTAADFWQMIWEQGSVVIVMLSRLMENGVAMCHRYWPEEGSEVYHIYEVHLVSEHIWCDDYLVRSFYLKNLRTTETRTVTQFHFMSWPDNGVPNSTKALLEFRRKVNKSYRGRSCPIVVHCSDGIGRTGTYCLIDMVLNRMAKGAKEIDIAATLEHVRDQRAGMVKTKAQFEFVLMAIAEEVHAILKALSQ